MKNGFILLPEGKALRRPPQGIISLVPSQTELLADLGLDNEVIGITKFCVHPGDWLRRKQKVGGTKNVDLKKIALLQPDLVIANREENLKAQVEELAGHYPVYVSDIRSVPDALDMIEDIGFLTNTADIAQRISVQVRRSFLELQRQGGIRQKVAYLIWKAPWMAVGRDTFIHDILSLAGFENVFGNQSRYPAFSLEALAEMRPGLIFLSSEPYPFKAKHQEDLAAVFPGARVILVDGELFSWYGSRLLRTAEYLRRLRARLL
ncbi:MAG TPA: helical backbone metal receptor [Edaphocola sp.]|nr:helical backbone metal receptor [Edaphocola sp.]